MAGRETGYSSIDLGREYSKKTAGGGLGGLTHRSSDVHAEGKDMYVFAINIGFR